MGTGGARGSYKARKTENDDIGLNESDKKNLRIAIRRVWSWSYSRRLAAARCINEDGFAVCEECKQKVAKITIDHIVPVGTLDSGFIERMFVPSNMLRAICKPCHQKHTNEQRKQRAEKEKS